MGNRLQMFCINGGQIDQFYTQEIIPRVVVFFSAKHGDGMALFYHPPGNFEYRFFDPSGLGSIDGAEADKADF